jgi:hypothetical protein
VGTGFQHGTGWQHESPLLKFFKYENFFHFLFENCVKWLHPNRTRNDCTLEMMFQVI